MRNWTKQQAEEALEEAERQANEAAKDLEWAEDRLAEARVERRLAKCDLDKAVRRVKTATNRLNRMGD